ncbi:hypothetical protein ACFZCU_38705 [Streptomyces canus]
MPVPALHYESELFYEKEVRSVTSDTREAGREFAGRFDGVAVLVNDLS